MDCTKSRIGLRSCGTPASPEPQLFVNDLPGITLENIDALATSSDDSFATVWERVKLRAEKKFEIIVKTKLNSCYKLTDKEVVECIVCAKIDLFDVALWYLHGTELMIERTSSDVMNRYTTIDIDKAEKLKAEFYTEFDAALNDAVNSIDPQDTDCLPNGCVECNDSVKWVYQTP